MDIKSNHDLEKMHLHAINLLKDGRIIEGCEFLNEAGKRGYTPSLNLLASYLLAGHGIDPDPMAAFSILRESASLGDPQAYYQCAEIWYCGIPDAVEQNQDEALIGLVRAAKAGYIPAIRSIGIFWVLDPSVPMDLSKKALLLAAQCGDAIAQHSYAQLIMEEAPETSYFWFSQAARAGLVRSETIRSSYAQVNVSRQNMTNEEISSLYAELMEHFDKFRFFSPSPRDIKLNRGVKGVVQEGQVLHKTLCDYIIHVGQPHLRTSKIVNERGDSVADPYRTGSTASFANVLDLGAAYIKTYICSLVGMDVSRAEPMALICYRPGDEYRPHFDFLPIDSKKTDKVYGGQRIATLLVYLNDDFTGGETRFTNLGIDVRPEQGSLLYFNNVDENGRPLTDSKHQGVAVEEGMKWLLSIWIREFEIFS